MSVDGETKGTLLVLLTALGSGAAIVVNRFFVAGMDPVVFTAVRALLVGFVFAAVSAKLPGGKPARLRDLALLGFIGGGFAFLLFFTGLPMTTAGRAAFIHKTLPVWAAVLAWAFLRERLGRGQAAAIALALLGLAVMQQDTLPTGVRSGDLLALGATVLWAVENTLAKLLMQNGETNWRVSAGRMLFGAALLFAVAGLQGKLGALLSLTAMQCLYVAVSAAFLGFYVLTFYWGLRHISVTKATGLLLLSPVVSLVLGAALLGEAVYPLQLAGSVLIIAGCWWLSRTRSEVLSGGTP
jgi:drug/metabolite transporter (DMT)-like permease